MVKPTRSNFCDDQLMALDIPAMKKVKVEYKEIQVAGHTLTGGRYMPFLNGAEAVRARRTPAILVV